MAASPIVVALFILQLFHVLFLALHDWLPLGRLNDVPAVRAENPGSRLLVATLISTVPFAYALVLSARHLHTPIPGGLRTYLWIAYGLLFLGELRAWWFPYAFGTDAARTARYNAMFGNTSAFLPRRHGIQPNTLHVVLHVATAAVLVLLAISTR